MMDWMSEKNQQMMAKNLRGQIVAITAGAGGIGLEIARHLNKCGARLAICDVDGEALGKTKLEFPDAVFAQFDVSDEYAVKKFIAQIDGAFGALNALINNAGIAGPTGGVDEISSKQFQRCLEVGLVGQFNCAHHAVPLLKSSGGGSIICMSSVAGKYGYAYRTPYCATKFGVIGLALSLAKELGPSNIRVNSILPGFVEGPRMTKVIEDRAVQEGISFEEMQTTYLQNVSLRKMVTAKDVAATIGFLLSDAGKNISGQSIAVDGNVETI